MSNTVEKTFKAQLEALTVEELDRYLDAGIYAAVQIDWVVEATYEKGYYDEEMDSEDSRIGFEQTMREIYRDWAWSTEATDPLIAVKILDMHDSILDEFVPEEFHERAQADLQRGVLIAAKYGHDVWEHPVHGTHAAKNATASN